VVAVLFPNLTQLDFTGPAQVFSVAPPGQIELHVAAALSAPVPTYSGFAIVPTCNFATAPQADVLLVPGGTGVNQAMADPAMLGFLRSQAAAARYLASVCTGSLLLGAAGLLEGKRATSHWNSVDLLERFGASPVHERVVQDGNLFTGAGVSAGIDMALTLLGELLGPDAARRAALVLEYNPQPPYVGDPTDPALAGLVAEGFTEVHALRAGLVEQAAGFLH
jgi:cyclohexyl-isocyanide hydratase